MNEREDHFLEHIRAELSLQTPEEAKPFVKSVLSALRKTLSRQNAEAMIKLFPDFLKNYFSASGQEEKEVNVEHLDELVDLVMRQDEKENTVLFKSEVQTLSVILYTLRRIFAGADESAVAGIKYPFINEVKGSY